MKTAEQKKAPELRFPEFSGEWQESRLGSLLSFKNGLNAPKEAYGSGYKFINVLDIINNTFITHDAIIGSVDVTEKEFKKNIVEYGDVLFQRSSETREEVGQSNVYLDRDRPATFGGFVIRGKKIADYDPIFMNLLLKSADVRKEITARSGGSTRYNIGQDSISEVEVQLPTETEQSKIAVFLSSIDRRIEGLEKKRELLKDYKKGLMQKLFNQSLRFENGSKPFPKWEEKKLGEVAECLDNQRKPLNESERFAMKGDVPYWGANNIMDHVNNFLFDEPIVLLAEDGGYFDEFKTRPIANISYGKCWVNNHAHVLRAKRETTTEFLFMSLVHKNITGYVGGGTRAKLNKGDMLKIKIQLPCLEEQRKIADCLSALDRKIEQVETQVARTREFKQGLLQKMFV